MDEIPFGVVAFVELEGRLGELVAAAIRDGEFRTQGLKPFPTPVVAWWSLERKNGSLVFPA